MHTYQNILFATDLTPTSEIVGDRAAIIANNAGAPLNLVHVMENVPAIYGRGEFGIALACKLDISLEDEIKERLMLQAQILDIPETRQWVLQGSSKDEIVHLAKHIRADLIVVGSHDRHGLSLLFNSTADAILHAMPCDVLAVKVCA